MTSNIQGVQIYALSAARASRARDFIFDTTWKLKNKIIWGSREIFSRKFKKIPNGKKACVIIFHDYERDYAIEKVNNFSEKGLNFILNVEKQYNIKATYNIVGKICKSHRSSVIRIAEEGHEIASHSYSHKDLRKLSNKKLREEVIKSIKVFKDLGIKINGFRSPMSRWDNRLITVLSKKNFLWNAEQAGVHRFPWYIKDELLRIPIHRDDWAYQKQKVRPEEMLRIFKNDISFAKSKNLYLAIGFHPWVEGLSDRRLKAFEKFIRELAQDTKISIKTFGEVAKFVKNQTFVAPSRNNKINERLL